jgi:hypothetical protein
MPVEALFDSSTRVVMQPAAMDMPMAAKTIRDSPEKPDEFSVLTTKLLEK